MNHGATPARNIGVNVWVDIDRRVTPNGKVGKLRSLSEIFEKQALARPDVNLSPQGAIKGRAKFKEPLSAEDLVDLRLKKKSIFVYGYVAYVDIFGKSQVTYFRWMHTPTIDDKGRVVFADEFTTHYKGNQAT
jgi:hypothetical protein